MRVPAYKHFIQPILRYLALHELGAATADACDVAARDLHLNASARAEQLTSGGLVYRNRAAWALNWLKRAGLAESPAPGQWQLTAEGKKLVDASPAVELEELMATFAARVDVRLSRNKRAVAARPPRAPRSIPTQSGHRKAYRLTPRPLAIGGQAEVYEAIRKADGRMLIFKRSLNRFGPNRMRREIDVQSSLQHPNIMPIFDWDRAHYSWYVMPRGTRTMSELRRPVDSQLLLRIVDSVVAALEVAHSAGHPHRDVKPQNIIELDDATVGVRWVVADWGLTRRALGATTSEWTETGKLLGSAGFAPPEAYQDAHNVGIPGDVYALGQLIAWALGVDPIPNVSPTVPGAWQQIVTFATQPEAKRRPQNMAEVRQLIPSVTD